MLNLVNFLSVSCILLKRLGGRERICEKARLVLNLMEINNTLLRYINVLISGMFKRFQVSGMSHKEFDKTHSFPYVINHRIVQRT